MKKAPAKKAPASKASKSSVAKKTAEAKKAVKKEVRTSKANNVTPTSTKKGKSAIAQSKKAKK